MFKRLGISITSIHRTHQVLLADIRVERAAKLTIQIQGFRTRPIILQDGNRDRSIIRLTAVPRVPLDLALVVYLLNAVPVRHLPADIPDLGPHVVVVEPELRAHVIGLLALREQGRRRRRGGRARRRRLDRRTHARAPGDPVVDGRQAGAGLDVPHDVRGREGPELGGRRCRRRLLYLRVPVARRGQRAHRLARVVGVSVRGVGLAVVEVALGCGVRTDVERAVGSVGGQGRRRVRARVGAR